MLIQKQNNESKPYNKLLIHKQNNESKPNSKTVNRMQINILSWQQKYSDKLSKSIPRL